MNDTNANRSEDTKNVGVNYDLPKWSKRFLPLMGLVALFIGFGANFNIESTLQNAINNSLKVSKGCNAKVTGTKINYLTFGVKFTDVVSSAKCPKIISNINSAYVGFRGVSFSPLGVRLKSELSIKNVKKPIGLLLSAGTSTFKLLIDQQKIDLKDLMGVLDSSFRANGVVEIDGLILGKYTKITQGKMELRIDKLLLPEQDIQGFIIPSLKVSKNIINLSLSKNNNVKVKGLKLGEKDDVVEILAQGEIKNTQSIRNLSFDLEGKFNFKPELNQEIPLLGLMLNGKKKSQGYYQFEFKGGLNKPKFKVK